jgi:hypothetical protein
MTIKVVHTIINMNKYIDAESVYFNYYSKHTHNYKTFSNPNQLYTRR